MTALRKRMTEDMQVRNLSPHTQTSYVQQVSLFARHFQKTPEVLGRADPRVSGLPHQRKEAGPRFHPHCRSRPALSLQSLAEEESWPFDEVIPAPKKPQKLPIVLSPEEVLHFLECIGSTKHNGRRPPAMLPACASRRPSACSSPISTASGW